jgi:hypothetical protein
MFTYTFWFEITSGDLEGEEFFVEVDDSCRRYAREKAVQKAKAIFPLERIRYVGAVSAFEAEMMGLDTY